MRWSPSGDKLASASGDKRVKLLDFKTGKVLYTGKTSDESKLSISECIIVIQKLYRRSLLSMLHLDKSETKGPREQAYSRECWPSSTNSDNNSVD